MSHAAGKLVVHYRSQGVAMGTLDAFFIMRCFGTVTPDDVRATLKCVDSLMSFRPEGSVSLVAVDHTSTFPSEATRRAGLDVLRKSGIQTVAQIVIVLGDGFWASAIRGVLTTLASLTQSNHPRRVARLESDGVEMAIEALGEAPGKYRAALLAALAELKAVTTAPPPASTPPASKSPSPPPSSKRQAG